jgi:hypothetical protein
MLFGYEFGIQKETCFAKEGLKINIKKWCKKVF